GHHIPTHPVVADEHPERDGDDRCDPHHDEGDHEVFRQALRDRPGTGPFARIGQPGKGGSQQVHQSTSIGRGVRAGRVARVVCLVVFRVVDHGSSRRCASTQQASRIRARAMVSTTPVTTSAMIPRWKPSVNRVPRLWMPTTDPTVTRLTVLTTTTRRPAMITGSASGNSTDQNLRAVE